MKTVAVNDEFKPLSLGLHSTWGFIIEGASGSTVLQVRAGNAWRPVKTFTESGTFLDELRRDATYRFSAIAASSVTVF